MNSVTHTIYWRQRHNAIARRAKDMSDEAYRTIELGTFAVFLHVDHVERVLATSVLRTIYPERSEWAIAL